MLLSASSDDVLDKISLKDAIKKLPHKRRVIVALITAGYTQEESGSILGRTRASVGHIYKDALAELKELLIAS